MGTYFDMTLPQWEKKMARAKPGETVTRALKDREQKLKAALARVEVQKQAARDRVTGKTKAQAYVRAWLERLTATELRHECEMRGFLYGDMETMEQAIDVVQAAMFSGVVVYAETTTFEPASRTGMYHRDAPAGGALTEEMDDNLQMDMPFGPS